MVVIPAVFPDAVGVVIFSQEGGPQLVAAIELVSPSNKNRSATRRAFVAKMSSYLQQGIALLADLSIELPLEETYLETCADQRIGSPEVEIRF